MKKTILFAVCLGAPLLTGCQNGYGSLGNANFTARVNFAKMADGTTTASALVSYGGPKPFLVDLNVTAMADEKGAQITAGAAQANKADVLKTGFIVGGAAVGGAVGAGVGGWPGAAVGIPVGAGAGYLGGLATEPAKPDASPTSVPPSPKTQAVK